MSQGRFCLGLSLIMGSLLALGCTGSNQVGPADAGKATPNATVSVAVLLDLSGGQETLGQPAANGFELAYNLAGDTVTRHTRLLSDDTRTDDEASKAAAERLAHSVLCGAGFTNNESLLIAGPFFQKAGKPFLSIGATDPAVPEEIGDCIFLTCFGDNTQAAAAAEFAKAEFGGKVAILWDSSTQYTQTLPKYFRTRFEELGGQVLLNESFEGCDLTELGKQISGLAEKPDFVYLAAMPECVGDEIASLRAAGVELPILGGDGLDTPNVLESEKGRNSDVWFTTHAWLSEKTGTEAAKKFVANYKSAYGQLPSNAFAALGYDAGNLLFEAMRRAKDKTPAALKTALEETKDFAGVTGTISFAPDQHVPLKTVWIIKVEDGKQSLAKSFVPGKVPPPLAADDAATEQEPEEAK